MDKYRCVSGWCNRHRFKDKLCYRHKAEPKRRVYTYKDLIANHKTYDRNCEKMVKAKRTGNNKLWERYLERERKLNNKGIIISKALFFYKRGYTTRRVNPTPSKKTFLKNNHRRYLSFLLAKA